MVLQKLRQVAQEKEITLNILVNQVLKLHIDWYVNAPKAGMVPLPKVAISKLVEKIDEADIIILANDISKNDGKNILLLQKNTCDLHSLLHAMQTWIKISGFSSTCEIKDDMHTFIIDHGMGKKWSLLISHIFQNMMEDLGAKKVENYASDSSVMFKVYV